MQRSFTLPVIDGPYFGYSGQATTPSAGLMNRYTGQLINDTINPNYPSGYGYSCNCGGRKPRRLVRRKKTNPLKKLKRKKANPLKKLIKKRKN